MHRVDRAGYRGLCSFVSSELLVVVNMEATGVMGITYAPRKKDTIVFYPLGRDSARKSSWYNNTQPESLLDHRGLLRVSVCVDIIAVSLGRRTR